MIWIQTARHSADITDFFKEKQQEQKKLILKKISADDKTMRNYLVGKNSR